METPKSAPSDARAAVQGGALLVDVRSVGEYGQRHIDGALNLPLGAPLDTALAAVRADGSTPLRGPDGNLRHVVVYCASGARSETAATQLTAAGFSVVDMGAMEAWDGIGLPKPLVKWVRCCGCHAVLPESDFQAHCGEVEHDDSFMFECEEAQNPPPEAGGKLGAALKSRATHPQAAAAQTELGSPPATKAPHPYSWRALPEVPVKNACRNWQYKWQAPCERLCCHTHPQNCPCADIACDACHFSVVRPHGATTVSMNGHEPMKRYVCLECKVDRDYDGSHWSTQLCEKCFAQPVSAPHIDSETGKLHRFWVEIKPDGTHSNVQRNIDGLSTVQIVAADLTKHQPKHGQDGNVCPACWVYDICDSNPPASLPGCTNESHMCCVEGCISRLAASGKLSYVRGKLSERPPATYFCQECASDNNRRLEVQSVLRELDSIVMGGMRLEEAVAQLKAAHALKPGDESVNKHLHQALDERVAQEQASTIDS